jgi:succinyldiaminopimelate transaminase
VNDRLRNLPPYPVTRLEVWRSEMLARGLEVFDFGAGDPCEPTPELLRQAMIEGIDAVSQYPCSAGVPELREAAAAYLQRRFHVTVDPVTQVLPTMGNKEALFHLPMTFVQVPSEKDLVLYGEPAYPVYEIGALFAEAWTYAARLSPGDGYALDPDMLPESVLRRAAVVFLNYPHNPTGACLSAELFGKWVACREEYGFVLVDDECYADLWYEGEPPHSLLEFGTTGCLVAHSLSKRSGMTGYRSGFLAGDPALIAVARRFRAGMGAVPQEFVQRAATVAWQDADHVEQRRELFAQKRAVMLEALRARGLTVHGSRAGIYLWVEVPAAADDLAYAARLREVGILAAPGSFFGKGQERCVRLALVPGVAQCRQAAARWPAG